MSSNRNDSVITDVFGKAKHVADQAQVRAAGARKKADEGVSKLGEMTHKNRASIDSRIDQAERFVIGKLGEKHSYKVSKVRDAVDWGLDRIADKRPATHAAETPMAAESPLSAETPTATQPAAGETPDDLTPQI